MAGRLVGDKDPALDKLRVCMAKFDAAEQKVIQSIRLAMQKRLPATNELLYDYGSFFVIAYSRTEHPLDAVASIAARGDGVRLYLMNGPRLPDAKKLLQGTGKQVRFVVLESAKQLRHPDIEALLAAAIESSGAPLPRTARGKLIDRSAAQKKRPRGKKAK